MLDQPIDSNRLRGDIASLVAVCATLKALLRTRWSRPMADEQRALCRRRRELTELHVLAAWLRGRLHVARPPREGRPPDAPWDARLHAERIAARVARDYTPPAPVMTSP